MKVMHILTSLALMLQVSTACAQGALTLADEEAAMRKVIVEMTEGFNRHDARASTIMYLPDADFVTARGEHFRGTEGYEKGLASILSTRAREATLRTLNVSVRFIRPDLALAHVTNELSGLIAPDGQRPPPQQELSLRVFVKQEGRWRVAAFHNTVVR